MQLCPLTGLYLGISSFMLLHEKLRSYVHIFAFDFRVVTPSDYPYLVQVIVSTTLNMPQEAVHTLMEAHHNLSEEISHFLFSFAFELEHATSEDIGKLVAEYAGNY